MRITSIRVRRLKSKAVGYGHYAIEAEAQVHQLSPTEWERPEDVRQALTDWVDAEIAKDEQSERLTYTLQSLMEQTKLWEKKLGFLKERVSAAHAVIAQHEELRKLAEKAGFEIAGLDKLGDELPLF